MTDLSKYDDERDKLNDEPVEALFKLFSVSSDKYVAALMYAAVLGAKSKQVDIDEMNLIVKTFEDARLSLMQLLLILIGAIGVSVENGEVCVEIIGNDNDEMHRQMKRHGIDVSQKYVDAISDLASQNTVKPVISAPARKSALDLLPEDVRIKILSGNAAGLRADLVIIPMAEALGWTASFQSDNWHSSVSLSKGDIRIWQSARGWRRALILNDKHTDHTVHADIEAALNYKPEPKEQNDNT